MAKLVISCEHGGHRVPRAYESLFVGKQRWLETHRGYDAGALAVARYLSRCFRAPLIFSTVTRLLVDLNRSEGHRQLWSEVTRGLSAAEREEILEWYYRPYRARVEEALQRGLRLHPSVIHLCVHTFTPVLNGRRRPTDIGLLYDPRRSAEAVLCRAWRRQLRAGRPTWRVHMNRPYQGRADGLATYLRQRFSRPYVGIELEINQRLLAADRRPPRRLCELLAASFDQARRTA